MSNRVSNGNPDRETLSRLLLLGLEANLPGASDLPINGTFAHMGENVGNYELLRELGRGGAGIVYLARHRDLKRLVALKILGSHSFSDSASRARFQREAELVASLQHPRIVRLYEFGIWKDMPFYSMEYIEGMNLRERMRKETLTWRQAATAAASIAETVHFAHLEGVIHRDLKPENVLIGVDEQLHLADFGLARKIETASGLTVTGVLVGTPHYIAPEVLSSYGREASASADQYAVGAILYEMLTGSFPFAGQNLGEVAENIGKLNPTPPSRIRPAIPKQLDAICLKALRKKPHQRYANTKELAEALNRALIDPSQSVHLSKKAVSGSPFFRKFLFGTFFVFVPLMGAGILCWQSLVQKSQITNAAILSNGSTAVILQPPHLAPVATIVREPWTNSLGLKFVPAGTEGVLFSSWDVRVKDFKTFVDATGYDATKGVISFRVGLWQREGVTADVGLWRQRGDTWQSPGFNQTSDDPVCGVSWDDANAFCQWLTKKEQTEGKLALDHEYRLPTDAEWSKAVGLDEESTGSPKEKGEKAENDIQWGTIFPWGTTYPPPLNAGNFNRNGDGSLASRYSDIPGNDGYPYTSPVGSYKPNSYGLCDMGGNVWNWCQDKFNGLDNRNVLRGSSCFTNARQHLLSSYRSGEQPFVRNVKYGFRIVLVLKR